MRRTDEAFKQEVLRRYGVQKRNRRNYFYLALSPLVLAIILGSLIFLPQLSRLFELTPANPPSKADDTPTLADIGALDIEKIEFSLPNKDSTYTLTDTEKIRVLLERMTKFETKVTRQGHGPHYGAVIAHFSSSEYETLSVYLWKNHDYIRIDAKPKGADEIVTQWYRLFNLDRQILRKAVYNAAGVTLVNTDHWDAILTEPIVRFSSLRSGIVTDPALIADLTELLQCLQLTPFPEGGMAPDVQTEQITLTLQSGKVITCRIYGTDHITIVYQTEGLKTETPTFICNDLEILLKLLENFKQTQPEEKPALSLEYYLQKRVDFYTLSHYEISDGSDRLRQALLDLEYTIVDPFQNNTNSVLDVYLYYSPYSYLEISIYSDGKGFARHTPSDTKFYFTVPKSSVPALQTLKDEIIADNTIPLTVLVPTKESTKLSFQNTYDYCTTVEVTSPGEIEEVYALFESISGIPVYGLEMTPGEGYKFTFTDTDGDQHWLIIDPNEPYVSYSYLPAGKSQPASRWYRIPTERWETIVSSWMRKWEKTMRSHVAAPPLESYLFIEQGRVSFQQNNQNVYPLEEDGKALLSLISEKLENTTILYDHPAFESWVQIRVEVGDLYTILTVSLDGNFITVSPCHNGFISVGDYYHFALPAEDMEEIQTYIESLTKPS